MEKDPKVSIIILNYNGKDCLMGTLLNAFSLEYSNFEIILVDNNSTDGSFEKAKSIFSEIVPIKNSENLGFSAGNNVGIKYALERDARYIFLLNYDAQVESNALNILIESMEKDKSIGLASPLIFKGNSKDVWFSGGKINWMKMKARHLQKEIKRDYHGSDYLTGCALLIRREVFKKIGLLDEDYFLYWEDADFGVKAKKEGFKLLVSAKSRASHFEKSLEKIDQKTYWLVISGLIFFQKNSLFFCVLGFFSIPR
jgi:GT2 family glycosyltransferase